MSDGHGKKMTIFQFSFGDGYAGSAKVALAGSELLLKRGHDVTLFATNGSLTEARAREANIPHVSLDTTRTLNDLMVDVRTEFERRKADAVITHHSLDRKVGFRLRRTYGRWFVNIAYRHNITKSAPIVGPLQYNLFFDYLVACSHGVAKSLSASGIRKRKIVVLHNGIDVPPNLKSISGTAIRWQLGIDNKIVLGLSTWFHKERKGFDILFDAFHQLDERFVLLIVGIPEEDREKVVRYAGEFAIAPGRLIMPGYVNNIWEYYKAMDMFLLPSRSEGFSLALLEAAAASLPIVASDIPGTNEFIVSGENGLLFDVHKPADLAAGVLSLATDRVRADRLAEAAHASVMQNYLLEHYGRKLETFLATAVGAIAR